MSPAYVEVDEKGLAELEHGDLARDMKKRGRRLVQLAKRQVGKQSRELERTLTYKLEHGPAGLVLWVGSPSGHALMHHNGTRPHIIVPHTQRYLRFTSKGKVVYARIVHHPGTRANRYLTDNLPSVVV